MPPDDLPHSAIAGAILAGGLSRRMGGGDKGLLLWQGRSLIEHVALRLRPQVSRLVLNANGDPGRFASFGLPVVADDLPGFPGPLAGVLAVLEHFRAGTETHVMVVPCDAPQLPADLVARLAAAWQAAGALGALAVSAGRRHPAVALWPVALAPALRDALVEEDLRRVDTFLRRHGFVEVEWLAEPADPFVNVNTPEGLAALGFSSGARPAG